MAGLNKAQIIGHLGRDPEYMVFDNSGNAMAKLSVATSEKYINRAGETITDVQWHSIICWRSMAETAHKYLKKGNQVYVEGKLKKRTWKDVNGNERWGIVIEATDLVLLDKYTPTTAQQNNMPAPPKSDTDKPKMSLEEQANLNEIINKVAGQDSDIPF